MTGPMSAGRHRDRYGLGDALRWLAENRPTALSVATEYVRIGTRGPASKRLVVRVPWPRVSLDRDPDHHARTRTDVNLIAKTGGPATPQPPTVGSPS